MFVVGILVDAEGVVRILLDAAIEDGRWGWHGIVQRGLR